jgi:hypothetical protein
MTATAAPTPLFAEFADLIARAHRPATHPDDRDRQRVLADLRTLLDVPADVADRVRG